MRQRPAQKGSEIIPTSHSSRNVEEVPNTVSDPNQVAKVVAITIVSGNHLPARI